MAERYLEGKVALITGAGRKAGLGQAIARRLASHGATIVLHDRGEVAGSLAPAHGVGTTSDLDTMAGELRASGAEVMVTACDLLADKAIAGMMRAVSDRFGRLDILVNNAGIGYLFGALIEMPTDEFDAVIGVNLRAPALCIKHAAPIMIAGGRGGRIINIASQAGKSGFAFASAYTASKHGLIGLTRSVALELGGQGITVNAICPNHVTTGLGAWQNEFMSKARGQSMDAYLTEMRNRIPLGRTGSPEDTAAVAAFLCSDDASYVTAESINVSGGEEYH